MCYSQSVFSVRGKSKVENEISFALMAVNLRKYTAINNKKDKNTICYEIRNGYAWFCPSLVIYERSVNTLSL